MSNLYMFKKEIILTLKNENNLIHRFHLTVINRPLNLLKLFSHIPIHN